jgi:transposase
MKDVKHYPDDFKLKVALHYLQTDDSYSETAKKFNLPGHKAVWDWVKRFKAEEIQSITGKRSKRQPYHEESFKREIVQHYMQSGDNMNETAKQFNHPISSVRRWILKYSHEFTDPAWTKNRSSINEHNNEFKKAVVRHYLSSDQSFFQTAKHFNLPNSEMVSSWVTIFGKDIINLTVRKPAKKFDPDKQEGLDAMAQRIRDLENALEEEKLKNVAANMMINVAERDLNISIRKKSGAKQSKK